MGFNTPHTMMNGGRVAIYVDKDNKRYPARDYQKPL